MTSPLAQLWQLLASDDPRAASSMLTDEASWDDPVFDRSVGATARETGVPRLAAWFRERSLGGASAIQPLRTVANERRVVVESMLWLRNGLVWNQTTQKAEPADRFQLAVAVVGDVAAKGAGKFDSIRIYFGTWSVFDGKPRLRVGPIAPMESESTQRVIEATPTLRAYFDCLARGDAAILEQFEPDGYFREPANNYSCGRDQLTQHFVHILKLGGVGVEFLTATREGNTLAFEVQTVKWGTKKMSQPQAGFASYDLGAHGKLLGGRVYDSVVPPEF